MRGGCAARAGADARDPPSPPPPPPTAKAFEAASMPTEAADAYKQAANANHKSGNSAKAAQMLENAARMVCAAAPGGESDAAAAELLERAAEYIAERGDIPRAAEAQIKAAKCVRARACALARVWRCGCGGVLVWPFWVRAL